VKTTIFNSINDIPIALWNSMLDGHSCTYSYEFWQVIEAAGLNDFSFNHVIFYAEDYTPVALASFFL